MKPAVKRGLMVGLTTLSSVAMGGAAMFYTTSLPAGAAEFALGVCVAAGWAVLLNKVSHLGTSD